jgi:hypothetical protein
MILMVNAIVNKDVVEEHAQIVKIYIGVIQSMENAKNVNVILMVQLHFNAIDKMELVYANLVAVEQNVMNVLEVILVNGQIVKLVVNVLTIGIQFYKH